MKAMLSRAVGGPETLELADVADPVPGKGEALIRVAACGVNFPDSLIIEDKYQFKPARPFSPGGEVAGRDRGGRRGRVGPRDRPARARLDRLGRHGGKGGVRGAAHHADPRRDAVRRRPPRS